MSRAVTAGDRIVVFGVAANDLTDLGTPSDGVNTYSLAQNVDTTDYPNVYVWTATAATTATLTISITRGGSGGDHWGMDVLTFSGSDGFGASNKTNVSSGAPSLGLTTVGDNSAIAACSADWNGGVITARTWRTVNSITPTSGNGLETVAVRDTGTYSIYAGYWSDAGTAGAKTVGLSAPTGQKYAIVAVEIKGAAGGATVNADAAVTATAGRTTAATVEQQANAAVTATAARATVAAVSQSAASTVSTTAATATAANVAQQAVAAVTATAGRATAATVSQAGATTITATATVTTAATVTSSSGGDVDVPIAAAIVTAAAVSQAGQSAVTATAARATAAAVTQQAGTVVTVMSATATAGQVDRVTSSTVTATATVTTAATVASSSGGDVDLAVTATIATSALREAVASSAVTAQWTAVTAATAVLNAASARAVVAAILTSATVQPLVVPLPPLGVRLTSILDQLVSHAKATGLFPGGVNTVEPKSKPPGRMSAAIWSQTIGPAVGASGLAATTARIVYLCRIYMNMVSQPEDAIDPRVLDAVGLLMEAYSGDFDLGGTVRNIDLLGQAGVPLSAEAGYIPQDGGMFRCYTITIPVLVNDAFAQEA